METEVKGKLYIEKGNGCVQIITISQEAFKNINRFGMAKVFNDMMNDLNGVKWNFVKID